MLSRKWSYEGESLLATTLATTSATTAATTAATTTLGTLKTFACRASQHNQTKQDLRLLTGFLGLCCGFGGRWRWIVIIVVIICSCNLLQSFRAVTG